MMYMEDDDGDTEELNEEASSDEMEWTYDWERLTRFFNTRTSCLNPYCMDFSPSTEQDRRVFKLPKDLNGRNPYTASFFCKKRDDWFIYRVILPVEKHIDQGDIFPVLDFLTRAAISEYINRARCKDPLRYFRDIRLPKDE